MTTPNPRYRIFYDIADDGVSTYAVQERTVDGEWETVLFPSNLTPAIYLYREAAFDHLEALQ